MKTFTFTANEEEIKALYLCMDAALRAAGEKALDAAVLVKKVLNTGEVVEEPAPEKHGHAERMKQVVKV